MSPWDLGRAVASLPPAIDDALPSHPGAQGAGSPPVPWRRLLAAPLRLFQRVAGPAETDHRKGRSGASPGRPRRGPGVAARARWVALRAATRGVALGQTHANLRRRNDESPNRRLGVELRRLVGPRGRGWRPTQFAEIGESRRSERRNQLPSKRLRRIRQFRRTVAIRRMPEGFWRSPSGSRASPAPWPPGAARADYLGRYTSMKTTRSR